MGGSIPHFIVSIGTKYHMCLTYSETSYNKLPNSENFFITDYILWDHIIYRLLSAYKITSEYSENLCTSVVPKVSVIQRLHCILYC